MSTHKKFGVGVWGYMKRRCRALGSDPRGVMDTAEGTSSEQTLLSTGKWLLSPDVGVSNEAVKNDEEDTVLSAVVS